MNNFLVGSWLELAVYFLWSTFVVLIWCFLLFLVNYKKNIYWTNKWWEPSPHHGNIFSYNWRKVCFKSFHLYNSPMQYMTKTLLILSSKHVRPTEVWPAVSTVTGILEIVFLSNLVSMRLVCWVSHSVSDNHLLYSVNSTNTPEILTDIFITETKWTYDSSIRIFLHISITNWLYWIDNLRNFHSNLT